MFKDRKVITCDIDGILTDYPNCWLDFLYERCGIRYGTTQEAKIREKDYSFYKDQYRESEYKANLPIDVRNKNALNRLAKKYDIVITTSRPIYEKKYPHLLQNTKKWLDNNGIEYKDLRYKDNEGKFLDGLNVEFHIDDEIDFANLVAKRGGTVYLVTSNRTPQEKIEGGVILKSNISEIAPPFFSVCIPSINRGKTIYRALKSVAEQSFKDFELVIVDCLSDDETVSEVERFFNSNTYISDPFEYTFKKRDYKPQGTEDWNEPLLLARGKYIAMLEGDDYWLSDHLLDAYEAISDNPNIGIYGSSNQGFTRPFHGIYKGGTREYCYVMRGV